MSQREFAAEPSDRPCRYEAWGCQEPADPDCDYCTRHWRHVSGIGVKLPKQPRRTPFTAARKARRGRSATKFSQAVLARSGGRCEACLLERLSICDGEATEAHHILPIAAALEAGWPRSLIFNPTLNGLAVSAKHHHHIHSGYGGRKDLVVARGLLATSPADHPNRALLPTPAAAPYPKGTTE